MLGLIVLFIFSFASPALSMIKIDLDGKVSQILPAVLGDNDEQKEESKREEKKEEKREERKIEESKKQVEKNREAEKKEVEKVREQLKKNFEQEKKIKETNREIVKKIENEIKEEKEKSIERIKLESETSMRISVASKSGEVEDLDDDEVEMETEHGVVGFKNRKGDSTVEITRGGSSAHTDLPLNIDPKTKKISVESEGEDFEVKVLPDEVLKSVPGDSVKQFEIVVENGQAVYLINDIKNEKLFGLFSVSIPNEVKVSGETGKALEVKQDFLNRVLDFLSI